MGVLVSSTFVGREVGADEGMAVGGDDRTKGHTTDAAVCKKHSVSSGHSDIQGSILQVNVEAAFVEQFAR